MATTSISTLVENQMRLVEEIQERCLAPNPAGLPFVQQLAIAIDKLMTLRSVAATESK
jgi:hypothetical protein